MKCETLHPQEIKRYPTPTHCCWCEDAREEGKRSYCEATAIEAVSVEDRVVFGAEFRNHADAHCPRCGVPRGNVHHINCRIDECPFCHWANPDCRCEAYEGGFDFVFDD